MTNEWDVLARVAAAAVLGGLVGWDREVRNRPAGIRTHMLVAAGSALFIGIAVLVGGELEAGGAQAVRSDLTRIAAGVVTGVGFLGAGSIIVRGDRIQGLTTAAGIWVVAGIGMAIGYGFWIAGALSTLIVVAIIAIGNLASRRIARPESAGDHAPPESAT